MPKKRGKKNAKSRADGNTEKRPLILAGDMEEYAKVIKCLGDRRLIIVLPDSTEMIALIPGRFRKRVWMVPSDIVLVQRRDFQEGRVDIIHKYKSDEVSKLHKQGATPDFFMEAEAKQDINCCGIIIGTEDYSESEFDFDNL